MRALALRAAFDAAAAARRALSSAACSSLWRADAGEAGLAARATTPALAPPPSGAALAATGWAPRRWMAVPKKKVSPSRRGIRSGRKHIARVQTLAKCSRCGTIMHVWQVPHAFCDDAACPSKLDAAPAKVEAAAPVAAE